MGILLEGQLSSSAVSLRGALLLARSPQKAGTASLFHHSTSTWGSGAPAAGRFALSKAGISICLCQALEQGKGL